MRPLSRRLFLVSAGASVVATACSSSGTSSADPTPTSASTTPTPSSSSAGPTALTASDFDGLATCMLFPSSAAGPFPLDEQLLRRDITEGYPGHPLRLGIRVVDADCAALPGAVVEIWHADATGDYSAFADGGGGKDEGPGTTFLRGTQIADVGGIVEFHTIYPGWYPGRAVHIHLRVRVDDELLLTGQMYFDDAYTAAVHAAEPYARFGPPDTPTDRDGLAGDVATDGSLLALTPEEGATLGLITVGVAT